MILYAKRRTLYAIYVLSFKLWFLAFRFKFLAEYQYTDGPVLVKTGNAYPTNRLIGESVNW